MKSLPLAEYLVKNGLCAEKKQAAALIMAGKVLLNDKPAYAGSLVKQKDVVRLRGQALPYASKGGLKLEGALTAMKLPVDGLVCLDAGASTGGFTDCLLQRGASMVYAVDAGYGQLTGVLRQNPRVVNLERTNLGDASLLLLNPQPVFATCDLSYLSLKEAVPLYQGILKGQGELVALVKPLFELENAAARRSGQVNARDYAPLLESLAAHFNQQVGMAVRDACASPVTGNAGTLEFFLRITFGGHEPAPDLTGKIRESVETALKTQPYRKAGEHQDDPA